MTFFSWNLIKFILLVFATTITFCFFVNLGLQRDCRKTAEKMGFDWYYSVATDCMVKPREQWVPLKSFRTLD